MTTLVPNELSPSLPGCTVLLSAFDLYVDIYSYLNRFLTSYPESLNQCVYDCGSALAKAKALIGFEAKNHTLKNQTNNL